VDECKPLVIGQRGARCRRRHSGLRARQRGLTPATFHLNLSCLVAEPAQLTQRIPRKVLTLSCKVDECKPFVDGGGDGDDDGDEKTMPASTLDRLQRMYPVASSTDWADQDPEAARCEGAAAVALALLSFAPRAHECVLEPPHRWRQGLGLIDVSRSAHLGRLTCPDWLIWNHWCVQIG
jgi:hypothetical protein